MNPLSSLAYHRRNKRRALLLVALLCLATLGVAVMVRLLDSIVEQVETTERYLTYLSVVQPLGDPLDPGIVSQIRAHPDVARVIPKDDLSILVPLNTSGGFPVFAVPESDVEFLVDTLELRLKEGRLPNARSNDIVLSEEIASALRLRIGDQIGRSIDERYYRSIPTTMVLAGILEGHPSAGSGRGPLASVHSSVSGPGVRLGLASYEYLESHKVYTFGSPSLLVVPQEGRKDKVDCFLEAEIASSRTNVITHQLLTETLAQVSLFVRLVFSIVDLLVAVVIALVVGAVNRIGLTQRMGEFGLLHAMGYGRDRLVRRVMLETMALAGLGWIVGLGLSWLLFAWLRSNFFAPSLELDLRNLAPIWFTAPIPLVVIAVVGWSTMRTFTRLDAVAILDRGELGIESSDRRRAVKRSSTRPLSSRTFYRRHGRRGLALAVPMALMMVAVASPVFLFAPMMQASENLYEYTRYVSIVWPRMGSTIDAGVMAQLRTHPAVARVVPAVEMGMHVKFPPINEDWVTIYGVPEDDLPHLVERYGLQWGEGRLPEPRSNEIVLVRAVAMNRGLHVGDTVGKPAYEDDHSIPTEMVVVGILRPRSGQALSSRARDAQAKKVWTGLASYEYLRSHESYSAEPVRALVIPVEGRKAELDAWLEESVASDRTAVVTYEKWLQERREMARMLIPILVAVEGIVASVAAIALAVLSYVFFSQRRQEFGTLHALGHSRRWLVRRTVGETATVVAIAWLAGSVVCMLGLIFMQVRLYAPKGLTLNLLDPTPWLFTLPMPLAVVAVSAGLVVWMLSRLDPVAVIERRS
jgi:putative ABC transport system permease protein